MKRFVEKGEAHVPVIEDETSQRLIGVIHDFDVSYAYHRAMLVAEGRKSCPRLRPGTGRTGPELRGRFVSREAASNRAPPYLYAQHGSAFERVGNFRANALYAKNGACWVLKKLRRLRPTALARLGKRRAKHC